MDRKIVSLAALFFVFCFAAMAYFVFPFTAISGDEEIRIDDFKVSPVENGEAIEVTLRGSGFGSDPRLSLSLDVANRKSVVGLLKTWSTVQDVAVVGDIAVLANGPLGVLVVDISVPSRPFIRGSLEVEGKAMAVDVRNGLAYVACAKGGVTVVDFSIPESPIALDRLSLPGIAWRLEARNGCLYVAGGNSGLHVVDISTPSALKHLATLSLDGHSVDLAVTGGAELMVASVRGGVHFVDISIPDRPVHVDNLSFSEPVLSVAAGDGLGFIADLSGHFHVIDLAPRLETPLVLDRLELLGKPTAVRYRNGRVCIAAITGVHLVDVSVPRSSRLIGTVGMRNARGVALHDEWLYIANSTGGMAIVEKGAVQPMQAIDYFNSKGSAMNLRLVDRTLYLADGDNGFKIMDVDREGRLHLVGQCPLEGKARDVAVIGSYAYIVNSETCMDVIDIARPEKPRYLGSVETMGLGMKIKLYRGMALVVTNKVTGTYGKKNRVSGLQVFNLQDPAHPKLIGSLELDRGSGSDLSVDEEGQTAYLIAGSGGVVALDLSDPYNPREVGTYSLPWPEHSFSPMLNSVYREGMLYVANGQNGLLVLDVTDRTTPELVGSLPTMASAIGVSVRDNRAYLAVGEQGITVADISNPKDLRTTARLDIPIYARQFVVRNNMAILGNGHRGVFVVPTPVEADLVSATPTKIVCRFPVPDMPGDYSLGIFGRHSYAEVEKPLTLPLN